MTLIVRVITRYTGQFRTRTNAILKATSLAGLTKHVSHDWASLLSLFHSRTLKRINETSIQLTSQTFPILLSSVSGVSNFDVLISRISIRPRNRGPVKATVENKTFECISVPYPRNFCIISCKLDAIPNEETSFALSLHVQTRRHNLCNNKNTSK